MVILDFKLRKVTLPLALPGLVSVGIFSFNHTWNEFIFALIFISSDKECPTTSCSKMDGTRHYS